MKKIILCLALIIPGSLSQAQSQTGGYRSLVDLGVCHGSNSLVLRFLDGDRLKVQQSRTDLDAQDRYCARYERRGYGKNTYICGKDAWDVHHQTDAELLVRVRPGLKNHVSVYDINGALVFESSNCTPHNGWTLVQ